jgi:hypothetical protein
MEHAMISSKIVCGEKSGTENTEREKERKREKKKEILSAGSYPVQVCSDIKLGGTALKNFSTKNMLYVQ